MTREQFDGFLKQFNAKPITAEGVLLYSIAMLLFDVRDQLNSLDSLWSRVETLH